MVNWIPELQAHEWPEGVLDHMDPSVLNASIELRKAAGVPMTPCPLFGAHVRTEGNSRHSTQGGTRLSDATDFFIPSHTTSIIRILQVAQRMPEIGGIGLYFDTRPSVMMHIDCRPERLEWVRIAGEYIYLHRDAAMYYAEIAAQLEKMR
jgi:hypothetical protein